MKTRTMYMHTIADRPASFDTMGGGYFHYVGGRNKAKLAASLDQVRRNQVTAFAVIEREQGWEKADNEAARWGYVLVSVPIDV